MGQPFPRGEERTTPARTLSRRRCPFQDGAVFSAGSNPDFDLCATVGEFHPAFLGRRIGFSMKRTAGIGIAFPARNERLAEVRLRGQGLFFRDFFRQDGGAPFEGACVLAGEWGKVGLMSKEPAKTYEPGPVEERLYGEWEGSGVYGADAASEKPAYALVIPPPNVTGVLTLGHVLNNTIQDILARRARMLGHEVLWLPGTDHAGIATQTVVERALRRDEGRTRHDLGREAFLEKVHAWKEKHGGIIVRQLKRLGCSCDWGRERFTMDAAYARGVQEVFVDLYEKGMIYRGRRMVNWCPVSRTALSDEEVIPRPQSGFLYYFKVGVVGEPDTWLEIATTRPETIMGDTAVAVNPRDARYAHLIGKRVRRPLPPEQEVFLPIVGDEAVDFEFGTGVLKVTPAHDRTDYEIGLRHNLPVVDIMNDDGTLNGLAGDGFAGLDRFEARAEAVERLRELGLLVREEPYQNTVGFSERADVPVEPRLSEQWFLRYPKTREALEAVRDGLVQFFPKRWEKVYGHWMENIQDWCISRQLWWGHRIPVWYRGDKEMRCQIESPGDGWEQDPDVLDTWFSSWLWAHATMDPATRAKFYPTSVLVTGPDIIFFWVARMIMAGLEFTGEVPFRHVVFTGIIRDKQGRKMSKSLGNSPDPLDLIGKYGADGLRFGLLRIAPQGQDIRFDERQIVEGRNFCNKLWNACRFRAMQGPVDPAAEPRAGELPLCAADMLGRLDATIERTGAAYEHYRFSEVAQAVYDFVWGDFCDRFLEASKPDLSGPDGRRRRGVLAAMDRALSCVLRMLHPFAPFVTAELWRGLGFGEDIQFAPWPEAAGFAADPRCTGLYAAAAAARNARSTYRIASNAKIAWSLCGGPAWMDAETPVLASLLGAESVVMRDAPPEGLAAAVPTEIGTLYLPLGGIVDVAAEIARLGGEAAKVGGEIAKVRAKLSNPTFVDNAPPEVVAEHRQREDGWVARLEALRAAIQNLGG
jgi:valyl-tRNA synthetase